MLFAYSTCFSEIGNIFTWCGASHVGKFPLVSSNKNEINLSEEPSIALCITTGLCAFPSSPIYSNSNLSGSAKSNWQVGIVTSCPRAV